MIYTFMNVTTIRYYSQTLTFLHYKKHIPNIIYKYVYDNDI